MKLKTYNKADYIVCAIDSLKKIKNMDIIGLMGQTKTMCMGFVKELGDPNIYPLPGKREIKELKSLINSWIKRYKEELDKL